MKAVRPILIDLPFPIHTPRLLIRPVQAGDGKLTHEAHLESRQEFSPWFPWTREKELTEEFAEEDCRKAVARFVLREDIRLPIFDRSGHLVGSTGLHRMNWQHGIFEIGYWVRSSCVGKGYITEAANAMTRYCFGQLGAKRVEIQCHVENTRSSAVAERLGFTREAVLKNHNTYAADDIACRDSVVYARTNLDGLPDLEVTW